MKYICNNLRELSQCLTSYKLSQISLDTETTSLHYDELECEVITIHNGEDSIYISCIDDIPKDFLGKTKLLIMHNAVFDMKVLHKIGITIPEDTKIFDTMVAHHLLDEESSHSLKFLAQTLLQETTIDYKTAKGIGGDTFINYALNDAIWTYKLAEIFLPKLIDDGLLPLMENIEMPFQRVLLDIELNGMYVDNERVQNTTKELEQAHEQLLLEMLETIKEPYELQFDLLGGSKIITKINFNSSHHLIDIIVNRLGLTIKEKTNKGGLSVGAKTLSNLKGKHKFIDMLIQYKIIQKLLTSFFRPLPNFVHSNLIRPSYRDTGTVTGRLSCSSPNLQQLPKKRKEFPVDTRACFVAPEGYKMITCDYSGQELRILAHITQSSTLMDSFNKGKDLHLSTANDFYELNIPEEALYTKHKDNSKYKEKYYTERSNAKIINFGIAYGKGKFGFAKDFDITEDEAQLILDKYFGTLPAVKNAIEACHKQVDNKGQVSTIVGRTRHFKKIEKNGWVGYPKAAYRKSFNFLIQGFASDMIRIAGIKCRELSLKHPEWGLKVCGTVHDEFIWVCKEEYVVVAGDMIKYEFENAVKLSVPIVADVSIGNNYSEAK